MNNEPDRRLGAAQGWTAAEEIAALVSGRGRYTADVTMEGQVHAAFLRSMFANGTLRSLDTRPAESVPGVRAVLTGQDVRADGLADLKPVAVFPNADGTPMAATPRPLLAVDRVRYVGEPLAMVVADTRAAAEDAVAALAPDVVMEDAVAGIEAALADDASSVWPDVPDNVGLRWRAGDSEATDAAFRRAAHVTRLRLENP
ncbi:MAG TPA: xanthine dehydrogenase family protein molybdopterin-binding subunit, partial [Gammaproteobacteria bacterium]|nr:xanthine dehydrogenase family protein molybdopterin-binding subunit [Gammaproteobacteria bacterium]